MKKILVILGLTLFLASAANSAFAYSTEGAMYYNEGLDLYSRGEYGKAIESFKSAVAKDPDFVDAYYNLGALYEFLKSYQSAIASYSKINLIPMIKKRYTNLQNCITRSEIQKEHYFM